MNLRTSVLAICAATIILAAGCGKTDQPSLSKQPGDAPSAQASVAAPTVPTPLLPDPVVPKGAEAASPIPGQAGDHSSPAFKEGGKSDPHK